LSSLLSNQEKKFIFNK